MSLSPETIQPVEHKTQLFVLLSAIGSPSHRKLICKTAQPEWFVGEDRLTFESMLAAHHNPIEFDHLRFMEGIGDSQRDKLVKGRSELPIIPREAELIEQWLKTLSDASLLRKAQAILQRRLLEATNGTNPHALIAEAQSDLTMLGKDRKDNPLRPMSTVETETMLIMNEWKSGDIYAGRTQTRYSVLDRKIGGLRKKKLTILAGRPGMGKSTMAIATAANVARDILVMKRQARVVIFSSEMEAVEIMEIIASSISGIATEWYRTGKVGSGKSERPITEAEKAKYEAAIKTAGTLPISIDDSSSLTTSDMMNRLISLEAETPDGIDLIVMDYGLLLSDKREKGQSKDEWCGMVTKRCLDIAGRFDCPFLLLWQLNREADDRGDKMPELSDLRESGNVEQDAHTVIFLMRPAYYGEYNELTSKWSYSSENVRKLAESFDNDQGMIVKIAKNRGGAVGVVKLYIDLPTKTVYETITDRPLIL